jgi:hypothetical protein
VGVAVAEMYVEDLDDEELLEEKEEELMELLEEFRLAEEERRGWGRQVRQAKREMERAAGRLQRWLGFVIEHEAGSGKESWPAVQARLGCRRRRKELAACRRVHAACEGNEEEAMAEEAEALWWAEATETQIEDLRELVADRVAAAAVKEAETATVTAVATAATAAKASPQEVGPSGPAPGERLVAVTAAVATATTGAGGAGVSESDGPAMVAGVVGATQGDWPAVVGAGVGLPAVVDAGVDLLPPAGKKKSGAQVRRQARRAAMQANKEKAVGRSDAAAFRGVAIEAGALQAGGMIEGGSVVATEAVGARTVAMDAVGEVRVGSEAQDGAAAAQEQSQVFDPRGV